MNGKRMENEWKMKRMMKSTITSHRLEARPHFQNGRKNSCLLKIGPISNQSQHALHSSICEMTISDSNL